MGFKVCDVGASHSLSINGNLYVSAPLWSPSGHGGFHHGLNPTRLQIRFTTVSVLNCLNYQNAPR